MAGIGDLLGKVPSMGTLLQLVARGGSEALDWNQRNRAAIDKDMAAKHAYHNRGIAERERSNAPSKINMSPTPIGLAPLAPLTPPAPTPIGLAPLAPLTPPAPTPYGLAPTRAPQQPMWETSPWGPQPAPFNPAISNTPTYDQTPRLGGTVAAGPAGQYDPMRSANYSIQPLIEGPFDPRMTAPMPRKLPPMPYLAEPPARTGGDERLQRERVLPEPTQYNPSPRDEMLARAVQALVNMPSTQPRINMSPMPKGTFFTSEPKEATPQKAAIGYGEAGPFGNFSGNISLQDLLMDYLGFQNMAQAEPYNRLWAANPMAVTGNPQRSYSGGY